MLCAVILFKTMLLFRISAAEGESNRRCYHCFFRSSLLSCVFFSCQTNIIRFRHTIDMFANGTLAYSRVKMDEVSLQLQPSSTGAYRDGLPMTKNPACSFWSPFFTRAVTDTEVVLALQPRHWDTTTYRGFEYNRIIVFHCRLFTHKNGK